MSRSVGLFCVIERRICTQHVAGEFPPTQNNEWTMRRSCSVVETLGLPYSRSCFRQIISIVCLEVTCHPASFSLLDLVPVGHMVAFTKTVLIKAELSKTKLLIVVFFYKRAYSNHKWGDVVIHMKIFNPQLNYEEKGDHFTSLTSYTCSQIWLV